MECEEEREKVLVRVRRSEFARGEEARERLDEVKPREILRRWYVY